MLLALVRRQRSARSAPAPAPARRPPGRADPEEQFMLDVQHPPAAARRHGPRLQHARGHMCRLRRLSDGARRADADRSWREEGERLGVQGKQQDRDRLRAPVECSYGVTRPKSWLPGTIRETPEGWCVQTSALSRWFGIGVKPVTSGSVLMLQSDEKLPVELAMERQQRAAHIHPASFDLTSLPQVRVPYRMWRAPALDFVVSGGVTYRASDGMQRRPREFGLCRRRNRAPVLRCAGHHRLTRASRACCGFAHSGPTPTAACSARCTRLISASATSKGSTAA